MSDESSPDSSLPSWAELYEGAPCGLVLCSDTGTVRHVNRTMCRWLDRAADQLVGRCRAQDLFSIGDQIFFQTHLFPLLHIQGSVSEVKVHIKRSDGGTLPVVLNALVHARDGQRYWQLAFFIAKDRDQYEVELLKARKNAEALLEQERRTLDALAKTREALEQQRLLAEDRANLAEVLVGIVSHDLRNPLGVIRTSAHILGAGEQTDRQRQTLQRMHRAIDRAARMIADLLDLTQVRLGSGLQVKRGAIDLHEVISELVLDLRLAFPDRDIVHHRHGSGQCMGDSDRLAQLVSNLVGNAATYGASNEPITIVSLMSPSLCEVSVHNRGEPIPAELIRTIFEPLRRGDGAIGGEHSIGLGLFIVQAIARAHGGDASVSSTAVEGTRFTVRWPAPSADLPPPR